MPWHVLISRDGNSQVARQLTSVHGNTPEEVRQDKEGLQIMRTLGDNMAWLLKCIEAAKGTVPYPVREPWTPTNFIR